MNYARTRKWAAPTSVLETKRKGVQKSTRLILGTEERGESLGTSDATPVSGTGGGRVCGGLPGRGPAGSGKTPAAAARDGLFGCPPGVLSACLESRSVPPAAGRSVHVSTGEGARPYTRPLGHESGEVEEARPAVPRPGGQPVSESARALGLARGARPELVRRDNCVRGFRGAWPGPTWASRVKHPKGGIQSPSLFCSWEDE